MRCRTVGIAQNIQLQIRILRQHLNFAPTFKFRAVQTLTNASRTAAAARAQTMARARTRSAASRADVWEASHHWTFDVRFSMISTLIGRCRANSQSASRTSKIEHQTSNGETPPRAQNNQLKSVSPNAYVWYEGKLTEC